MKKYLILFILIVIPVFFFKDFFIKNFLPIPSDTLVGLYHPYRDFYAKDYARGIPFKNFLITDPVRQQYPWKKLSVDLEKKFQLPIWNPYNFTGTPLLANFQAGAFYPLNILFFIFPFAFSWSIFIFLQPVMAGIFMYIYLREIKVSNFSSLFGAIIFSFCGFSISWLEWGIIGHTILWLPLILLIKEILLEKFKIKWAILLIFVEVSAVFAGHLQTLFYLMCLSNSYLIIRISQKVLLESSYRKRFLSRFLKIYYPFLIVGILVFVITLIQWLPSLNFISLSGRELDQVNWQKQEWFIPWENLIQFIAPDFFGNPATLNYWGIWNYAEFVGYIGILPFIMAVLAILFRRDKKTLFFTAVTLICFIFALPTFFAKIPFLLHIPFISSSQPTRLIGIIDFCLSILAALGLDYFWNNKKKVFYPLVIITIIYALLWIFVLFLFKNFSLSLENIMVMKSNLIFPSLVYFLSLLILISGLFVKNKFKNIWFIIVILFITFDLFRFAFKFTPFTSSNYLFPQTKALDFLKFNIGNYRYMTTDSEILPPNASIIYKLQSVDGYDPLFLKTYAELIAASERGSANILPPFGFNRIITPHNYKSSIINLLGVKYILSLNDLKENYLKKVFQEGETRIYENKKALPRVFFVKQVSIVSSKQDEINKMFLLTTSFLDTAFINSPLANKIYIKGQASILTYSENEIDIKTNNSGLGFLVLTDAWYPIWHATIDKKQTNIFITDYVFRGIIVPKGNHMIRFTNSLF